MRTTKRCPEVEQFESMMLLSGAGGAPLPNPLILTGSIHGSYHVVGTVSHSTGSGTLASLGKVSETGTTTLTGGSAKITSSKLGTLTLSFSDVSVVLDGYTAHFTITNGTRKLAHETGLGSVLTEVTGTTMKGTFSSTYSFGL
jgi:hypothetical protein